MLNDALVVHGAVETAEVVDKSYKCHCKNCGQEISIVGGIVTTGSMTILGDNQKTLVCPNCGNNVELSIGG